MWELPPQGFFYAQKEVSRCQGNQSVPCSYPGCPRLTDGRFCAEHEKLEAKRYEKYDRDPAAKRRYGRAWKRIRDRYMHAHPLCEKCLKEGRLTEAEQVQSYQAVSRRR